MPATLSFLSVAAVIVRGFTDQREGLFHNRIRIRECRRPQDAVVALPST
jgi:hypothetical protein